MSTLLSVLFLLACVYWLLLLPPILKPWWGIVRPEHHKNSKWFT